MKTHEIYEVSVPPGPLRLKTVPGPENRGMVISSFVPLQPGQVPNVVQEHGKIREGMKIISVDGVSISGWDFKRAVKLFKEKFFSHKVIRFQQLTLEEKLKLTLDGFKRDPPEVKSARMPSVLQDASAFAGADSRARAACDCGLGW